MKKRLRPDRRTNDEGRKTQKGSYNESSTNPMDHEENTKESLSKEL